MRPTWLLPVAVALLLGTLLQGVTAGDDKTDGDNAHAGHGNHGNDPTEKTHVEGDHKKTGQEHAQKHHTWSYNIDKDRLGPDQWGKLFPDQCGSVMKRQSPIDIVTSETQYYELLDDVDVISNAKSVGQVETPAEQPETKAEAGEETKGETEVDQDKQSIMGDEGETVKATSSVGKMHLFNNGHTAQVDVEGDVYVMGGDLGDQYKVAQFHFHWGKNGSVGTEHRINGDMFMLEMHIVTYDSERYATLGDAVGKENGIAVLGILFKKGKHNSYLDNVINNLEKVKEPEGRDGKVPIDWVDIRDVMPSKTDRYYRYYGSLTTPTCAETVVWTVFAEHPSICPHQMHKFYQLIESHTESGEAVNLVNNWRPPQPLQSRVVRRSFPSREKLVEYAVGKSEDPTNASSRVLQSFLLLPLLLVLQACRLGQALL